MTNDPCRVAEAFHNYFIDSTKSLIHNVSGSNELVTPIH